MNRGIGLFSKFWDIKVILCVYCLVYGFWVGFLNLSFGKEGWKGFERRVSWEGFCVFCFWWLLLVFLRIGEESEEFWVFFSCVVVS